MSEFRSHLAQICDLNHAAAVLEWDQETYMPSAAAEARAHQIATLRRLAHELLVSEKTATHLEKGSDDSSSDDGALYRVTQRDFDRATRIPADLVEELAETAALARQAWRVVFRCKLP